jgi:FtsH-binding integral membrane protein
MGLLFPSQLFGGLRMLQEQMLPTMSAAELAQLRTSLVWRTYALLFLGLLVSAAGALTTMLYRPLLIAVVENIWVALLVELGLVIVAGRVAHRSPWNKLAYFAFTLVSGLTLGPVVLLYTIQSGSGLVLQAFSMTALIFAILSGVVFVTKLNFDFLKVGLLMALLTMVIGGALNLFFFKSDLASLFFACMGVIVFSGYILFDTSRMLRYPHALTPTIMALQLYLNVVNLFLSLLRILGGRRRG